MSDGLRCGSFVGSHTSGLIRNRDGHNIIVGQHLKHRGSNASNILSMHAV